MAAFRYTQFPDNANQSVDFSAHLAFKQQETTWTLR